MSKEFLYFDRLPGRGPEQYPAFQGGAPFLGAFLFLRDVESYCFDHLRSLLAQTYTNFAFALFVPSSQATAAEEKLRAGDLDDPRIRVYGFESGETAQLAGVFPEETEYLFQLSSGMRLDKTLFELLFSALTAAEEDFDVVYTNQLDYRKESFFRDTIASAKKREIWLPSAGFLFRRSLLDSGKLNELQQFVLTNHSVNVLHLDFYGVWDTDVRYHTFYLTDGIFRNFPRSSHYYFDTDPTELEFKLTPIVPKNGKSILCIVPWAKIGGADKFNLNVFSYLKSQGYHIFAVSTEVCGYEARQDMEDSVEAYYDLTTFLERKYWPDFLCSLIRTQNIQVIFQSSSLYGYHLIPWLKYQFPNLPIFDYLHSADFSWRNGGYPRDSNAVAHLLEKTYTCNAYLAKLMIERMHRSVRNVETLYIGVDTDLFDPSQVEVTDRETLAFCKGKHVILFACRFSSEKRPLFPIRLMLELSKRRDDIVCLMVGGGPLEADIHAQIAQEQLESKIRVIPMSTDILQYYKMASVTLICSLFEGLTLTTYESLAMGVPVITADVGGQREIVNETNGAVVKVYQDIRKDLQNYDYSTEELQEYSDAVERILATTYAPNALRENITKNYSYHKLFSTFRGTIDSLIESGSHVDPALTSNRELAVRYLVLFNEASRVSFDNTLPDTTPLEQMGQRMYRHWWYRAALKTVQALKLNVLLRKLYYALRGGKGS